MDTKLLYDEIFRRRSHRSYYNDILSRDEEQLVRDSIAELKPLYPEIGCRLELAPKSMVRSMMTWRPPHAVLAYSEVRDGYLENIGFMLEQLDLALQAHGLGTCWIGIGQPREGGAECSDVEYVIMLAVGKTKEGARDIGDFKRRSLSEISDTEDPRLEPARLAPSSVNSQPWYFEHAECGIRLYKKRLVRTPGLSRMNRIDVGIAAAHIYVANPETFAHFIENPTPVRDKMDYVLTFNV